MRISKTSQYLATFNLFLIFIGYQLVTSLLLPNYASYEGTTEGSSISRLVTIPYRIFALVVSLIVLLQNWNKKVKFNTPIKLYFVFWALLIFRIIYDLYIRPDIPVNKGDARETIIFVFFVCLLPVLSVYKSLGTINFRKAFLSIFFGYIFLIPVFYLNNPLLFSTESSNYRLSGNIAMNTIAFGHYGVTLALLAFYWGRNVTTYWKKVASYLLIFVGAFVMIRAGSRGPLVAFVACFIFYFIAKQKTSIGIMLVGLLFVVLSYALSDFFFDAIRTISPLLATRMTLSGSSTEIEDFSNGRVSLYDEALNRFFDSPLIGESFAIFNPDGSYIYSHNMILDAFMALGLFGGMLFVVMLGFAVFHSRNIILFKFRHWWIAPVCVQYIIYNLFSGTFYQSCTLNVLLIITLYYSRRRNIHKKKSFQEKTN